MDRLIEAALLANLLLSVIYAVVKLVKKENCAMVLLFLFFPVFGFVLYFLPMGLARACNRFDYDRESLVRRLDIERSTTQPLMGEELDVVPIEDAMAVSNNDKKRALLLTQLKKDYMHNYKELLSAENDSDSESAHYIAAAKMEVYSIYQQKWMEKMRLFQSDPTDDNWDALIGTLAAFVESNLLSPQEKNIYKKKYVQLTQTQLEKSDYWNREVAATYTQYTADIGNRQDAIQFWQENAHRMRTEKAYLTALGLYYDAKDKPHFTECLENLRQDKTVELSPEGLAQLRYWTNKEMSYT